MKFNSIVLFFTAILLFLLLLRCANPVSPSGGPKDIKPPRVVLCDPPNFSTQFRSRSIKIEFDEFVQLKEPNNNIIISPPLLPETDFKLRGKTIIIRIDDSLRPNITYSINFGNAIADITENNILQNFVYVFSTGSHIDSLTFRGHVVDAFDLTPQKEVLAMLYIDENDTIPFDSLPYKAKPYYITRTNESGEFSLTNLRDVPMKVFALKDLNNNSIYDLPDERIAFGDSLIHGVFIPPQVSDTLKKDSTAVKDTIQKTGKPASGYTIRMFQMYDSVQNIVKAELIQNGQIRIIFRYPVKHPLYNPLNLLSTSDWKIEEYNRRKDTVNLWLKNIIADSLYLQVMDKDKVVDTLRLPLIKKEEKSRGKQKEKVLPKITFSSTINGGSFKQFKTDLLITASYPLKGFKAFSVLLIEAKDTLHPKTEFTDSLRRTIRISHKWKEENKYILLIPGSFCTGINDLTNDTLRLDFRTRMARDYGSLFLHINLLTHPGPWIIQLLDEKDAVVEERIINGSEKIRFEYLAARKYRIKAIFDHNRNGRWDTGDYLKNIQPEEVIFFPKTIEMRANWEVEETWDL